MEAFVYVWSNNISGKKYIGYHKGLIDDGYISSSKNQEFWDDFEKGILTRKIVFTGTVEECVKQESSLIKSEDTSLLYNRNLNGKVIFTEDVRKKMAVAHTGRKQSSTWVENRSKALKGRKGGFIGKKHSEETIKKMKSVIRTEEHKQAISDAIKGRPGTFAGKQHQKVVCPHCSKQISVNTFSRWHGDNCKENK